MVLTTCRLRLADAGSLQTKRCGRYQQSLKQTRAAAGVSTDTKHLCGQDRSLQFLYAANTARPLSTESDLEEHQLFKQYRLLFQ